MSTKFSKHDILEFKRISFTFHPLEDKQFEIITRLNTFSISFLIHVRENLLCYVTFLELYLSLENFPSG